MILAGQKMSDLYVEVLYVRNIPDYVYLNVVPGSNGYQIHMILYCLFEAYNFILRLKQ